MIDFPQIITKDRILMNGQTVGIQNKKDLFEFMTDAFFETDVIQSPETFINDLYVRETQGSTYMGNFVAIPHGLSEEVLQSSLAICILDEPIEYNSCGETGLVKYIFMFAIEKEKAGTVYLKILSSLARLLANEEFMKELANAKYPEDILELLSNRR
ncbi:PTS sugar transporter subunit IIA [Tetragenococcus solitarius]|uniref:Fructose PTS transporter subunit IIA n=1 Tax=Tetragenococcus solitarius TaxID=71453 RepID=A0ABN3Y3T2_9ENTE|nr:PTS sugar transporter subunit IIA [Tetragenococcus solitarius]